jgi:hypothetical protein
MITENIIVMDDQMKNIIGNEPGDVGGNLIILAAVTGKNTDPAIESRAEQEIATRFFRHLVKGFTNRVRVFSSDMD